MESLCTATLGGDLLRLIQNWKVESEHGYEKEVLHPNTS